MGSGGPQIPFGDAPCWPDRIPIGTLQEELHAGPPGSLRGDGCTCLAAHALGREKRGARVLAEVPAC